MGIKDGYVSSNGYGRLPRIAYKRYRPRRLNAHHHLNLHHGYDASEPVTKHGFPSEKRYVQSLKRDAS